MDCIPISGRRGAFVSGKVAYSNGRFELSSEEDMKDAMGRTHSGTQHDDVVPILDVDSFRRRYLNPDLVKEVKLRGRRLWLITYIRSVDDIIDSMCGTFDMLCIPYHTIDDPDVLSEGLEISDCLIPTIFVDRSGRPIYGSLDRTIKDIYGRGFHEYALFNVDDTTLEHHCPYNDPDIISESSFTVL